MGWLEWRARGGPLQYWGGIAILAMLGLLLLFFRFTPLGLAMRAASFDQETALALGIDPGIRGDHGYSGTYLSHISWRSKTTPSALELNPKPRCTRSPLS